MIFVVWLNTLTQKALTVAARETLPGEAIPPGTWSDAAPIKQYPYGNVRNQHWLELPNDDGSYRYHNRESAMVIDARGGVIPGAFLQQYARNDGPNQRWRPVRQSDGTLVVAAAGTTQVWLIGDGTARDGSPVVIADPEYSGYPDIPGVLGPPQLFKYWNKQITDEIAAWRIASQVPPGPGMLAMVLDVPSGTDEEGAEIQQFPDHGGLDSGATNQAWEIIDLDGTYYRIRSICNGLYLSVRAGVLAAGTAIVQYGDVGGAISDWAIPSLRNGTPEIPGPIIPRNDQSLRLDVRGSSTTPGFFLQVFPDNSGGDPNRQTLNQLWGLISHV